jgi:hypothetical protein
VVAWTVYYHECGAAQVAAGELMELVYNGRKLRSVFAPLGGCAGCAAERDHEMCGQLTDQVSCDREEIIWQDKEAPMTKEQDPTGRDAHAPGAKLDAGKNRLGLVLGGFARSLQEVGKVGTFGANKYTDNGWREVPNGQARYTDAMFRHLLKEAAGEVNDPDSKLKHAAHAAWNALARLELALIEESDAQW